jgi:hypothetical protein
MALSSPVFPPPRSQSLFNGIAVKRTRYPEVGSNLHSLTYAFAGMQLRNHSKNEVRAAYSNWTHVAFGFLAINLGTTEC